MASEARKWKVRDQVYAVIDEERDYQDKQWGVPPARGEHSVAEWLVYMQDYLTEASHQVSRGADPDASRLALRTVRKITAMGVACMEQRGALPRRTDPPKPGTPHWLMGSPDNPNYGWPITLVARGPGRLVRWMKQRRADNRAFHGG